MEASKGQAQSGADEAFVVPCVQGRRDWAGDENWSRFYLECKEIIESHSLELYNFDYRPQSALLRVMIQNPQTKGASIEDCVAIDRALGPCFERAEWLSSGLTLEVSSPGLERPLIDLWHFEQSIGKRIVLKLMGQAGDGPEFSTGKVKGLLKGIEGSHFLLEVEGKECSIPMKLVKSARWVFEN